MLRRTSKYITTLVLTFFVLTVGAQTDSAEVNIDKHQHFYNDLPKRTGWVNDFENLFTEEQELSLDSIISIYKVKTGIEIAIITLDTSVTSKDKFDDFTLHIANTWGVGEKEKNNGVLIAISEGHRKMRIQNGYGIEKLITDNETKSIIDFYFIPDFKKGDYYQGTLTGLTKLIELLNEKIK
jgi:uncharacterized protein